MARVQIIETNSMYDGIQIIGGSDAYPDSHEDPDEDPDYRQRDWLHRHGIVIDDEIERIETFRWS